MPSRIAPSAPQSFATPQAVLIATVHLAAFAALLHVSWLGVALFVGLHVLTGCFGISLGFHRLLAHQAFQAPRSISASLRGIKDELLLDLLARISADEVQHLSLGAVFAQHCRAERAAHYAAWIKNATAAMRASSIPEALFAASYPDAVSRERAVRHALASAAIKRQARLVAATMMRTMRGLNWTFGAPGAALSDLFLGAYDSSAFNALIAAYTSAEVV